MEQAAFQPEDGVSSLLETFFEEESKAIKGESLKGEKMHVEQLHSCVAIAIHSGE